MEIEKDHIKSYSGGTYVAGGGTSEGATKQFYL